MTNNLKELTKDHHSSAERTEFTSIMLSGEINPKLYYYYLAAQHQCYTALEDAVDLPQEYEGVFRQAAILEDMNELDGLHEFGVELPELPSVQEYINRINTLKSANDNEGLLAHLYVRHFGDMSGGQIIRTRVPGAGTMYDFDDIDFLKSGIRGLLHDGMADEAKICFQYAEHMFNDLLNLTNVYYTESYALANDLPTEESSWDLDEDEIYE